MKTLKNAAIFAGKVIGLVFGRELHGPRDLLVKNFPYVAYGY